MSDSSNRCCFVPTEIAWMQALLGPAGYDEGRGHKTGKLNFNVCVFDNLFRTLFI